MFRDVPPMRNRPTVCLSVRGVYVLLEMRQAKQQDEKPQREPQQQEKTDLAEKNIGNGYSLVSLGVSVHQWSRIRHCREPGETCGAHHEHRNAQAHKVAKWNVQVSHHRHAQTTSLCFFSQPTSLCQTVITSNLKRGTYPNGTVALRRTFRDLYDHDGLFNITQDQVHVTIVCLWNARVSGPSCLSQ